VLEVSYAKFMRWKVYWKVENCQSVFTDHIPEFQKRTSRSGARNYSSMFQCCIFNIFKHRHARQPCLV